MEILTRKLSIDEMFYQSAQIQINQPSPIIKGLSATQMTAGGEIAAPPTLTPDLSQPMLHNTTPKEKVIAYVDKYGIYFVAAIVVGLIIYLNYQQSQERKEDDKKGLVSQAKKVDPSIDS